MISVNRTSYNVSNTSAATQDEVVVLIDNIAKHPTPEGLLLTLVPAGLMPRLWAWFIDLLIRGVIIAVISVIGAFFGDAGIGIIMIAYFLITWLYPVYFEVYRRGMTPGKKQQGIYVCHDDGTPISLPSSMTRNLLRVADFLPIGFAAGVLTVMFTQRSQRIGDIVAGTLVVYQQQDDLDKLYKSVYGFSRSQSDTHLPSAQVTFDPASPLFYYPLQLNEQQALVSYVDRLDLLSVARQQEIAYHLSPLIKTPAYSLQTKNIAIQQAILQKTMMIQGQTTQHNEGSNHLNAQANHLSNTVPASTITQQDNWR